ncbi:hypothetical protein [Terrisporobacter hibernicus]|uniref:hypothetical protein n=1 Tax=Terrisporobacter hibernicus TaxID=2813371 RepID=UPI0023F24505|nr:hypothetical protein [Terrisporobacter hibernicus]
MGKQIIRDLFLKISNHTNAKRVIVQPEKENKSSCGVLLSCGFEFDNKNEIYIKVL